MSWRKQPERTLPITFKAEAVLSYIERSHLVFEHARKSKSDLRMLEKEYRSMLIESQLISDCNVF